MGLFIPQVRIWHTTFADYLLINIWVWVTFCFCKQLVGARHTFIWLLTKLTCGTVNFRWQTNLYLLYRGNQFTKNKDKASYFLTNVLLWVQVNIFSCLNLKWWSVEKCARICIETPAYSKVRVFNLLTLGKKGLEGFNFGCQKIRGGKDHEVHHYLFNKYEIALQAHEFLFIGGSVYKL